MELPDFWRKRSFLSYLLYPLSLLYAAIVFLRRHAYQFGLLKVYRASVPVVVVGNLTVGGNGKTPLVIALTKAFLKKGICVGIVSRGYGMKMPKNIALLVDNSTNFADEPLLLARYAPVAVCPQRWRAIELLLTLENPPQIIISDDGLQHWAIARDFEIIAVASDLGFGNGLLLPAGALREPHRSADYLIYTDKIPRRYGFYHLNSGNTLMDADLLQRPRYALTTIARPERFFQQLSELKSTRSFPDHAPLTPEMAAFANDGYLFVTEKDAVKINAWPESKRDNVIVLAMEFELPSDLVQKILNKIKVFL